MSHEKSFKPFSQVAWPLFIFFYLLAFALLISGASLFFLTPLFIPAIVMFTFGMSFLTGLETHYVHYEPRWKITHYFEEQSEEESNEDIDIDQEISTTFEEESNIEQIIIPRTDDGRGPFFLPVPKSKPIDLPCPPQVKQQLENALRNYKGSGPLTIPLLTPTEIKLFKGLEGSQSVDKKENIEKYALVERCNRKNT